MICYPWTVNWKAQGQDIEEFKYFKRWFEELGARPAVQRGMAVGADLPGRPVGRPPEEQARRAQAALQPARPAGAGVTPHLTLPSPPRGAERVSAESVDVRRGMLLRLLEPVDLLRLPQSSADAEGTGDRHRLAADPGGRRVQRGQSKRAQFAGEARCGEGCLQQEGPAGLGAAFGHPHALPADRVPGEQRPRHARLHPA